MHLVCKWDAQNLLADLDQELCFKLGWLVYHAWLMQGVLIRKLEPIMDSAKKLKPYDIIMKFDGIQIASDGTVPFRHPLSPTPPPPPPLPLVSSASPLLHP